MRSNKEIAEEALRRAAINQKRKAVKRQRLYAVCSAAACIAVIVGLSFLLPSYKSGVVSEMPGVTSAVMLADAGAGGYIMMGVIGFALGAAVTLFVLKKKKKD